MGRKGEKGTDAATWPEKVGNKLRELESMWTERASGMAHVPLTGSAEESFLPALHKFGLAIACFSGFSVCQDFKECA